MRRASSGTCSASSQARASALSSPNTRATTPASKGPARCRQVRANSALRLETSSPSADSTPGAGGTRIVSHAEQTRERAAVQRPRAAERQEREVARVVAALDRHDAHRADHVVVDDRQDAARGGLHAHAQRLGDALRIAARAALDVEREAPPSR